MRVRMTVAIVSAVLYAATAAGQDLWPGATYDSRVPTLKAVVGHDPGEEISSPEEIGVYLKALAAAAPDRTRLVEYARTWEGRPLHVLAIASAARIASLDAVKADLRKLADPRGLSASDTSRLVTSLPVVTWLIHSVHGNEISSSDAALAEAYHLLAAQQDPMVDVILRESIVLIDPLQNPDGRARFLFQNRMGRAAEPDDERWSAEHDEPWPGGRSNHYLFDMNRDWFAQTQPETQGRLRVALDYFPHVVVDLHEMGGDGTYYFAPPADPLNPYITPDQIRWLEMFGRANAARFDARGFAYFIREEYDAFYPGYGDSWPTFNGAIGMTYEQASARGLTFKREDGRTLTFRDGVLHHFNSAITTAFTAAANRERLLRDFLEYRRSAVADGEKGAAREYVLVPGANGGMAARLARNLAAQGIEVRQAKEPFKIGSRQIPAGAFLVSAAQPAGRLVRNLLDVNVQQPEAFVKEQDRRRRKRQGDQIYDITAWSLPLLFDVEVLTSAQPVAASATAMSSKADPGTTPALAAAKVAYVLPWGSDTLAAAGELLRLGIRVQQTSKPFTAGGRTFPTGAAIVRVADQPASLADALGAVVGKYALDVVPLDSGWIDQGPSLGSAQVRTLRSPRIVLVWDEPTSTQSAGWARFVLERRFGLPVSAVRAGSLGRLDLDKADVLVMPAGSYGPTFNDDALRRLREWMRGGGTLVTLGEASRWAASEKVNLLETRTELRGGTPEVEEKDKDKEKGKPPDRAAPFEYEKAVEPERERPENTPGAVARVELDADHWLTAGTDGEIQAIVEGRRVFTPLKLDKGTNVGIYAAKERLIAAGLAWDDAQAQLARKAFLMEQPVGRGHVIAFAEEPNFRAFTEATELLFGNAVLLGPSY